MCLVCCLLSYAELLGYWRRGFRNGNLRTLPVMDRRFYWAAMEFARVESRIVSSYIIAQLRGIVNKLTRTIRNRILKAGLERAKELLSQFDEIGVFHWAPKLRRWLQDREYVLWLGVISRSQRKVGMG